MKTKASKLSQEQENRLAITCPLCNFQIKETGSACTSCPFSGNCKMIRCPNCGYELVNVSEFKKKWKSRFSK